MARQRRRDRKGHGILSFFLDRIANDWRALLWLGGLVALFTALIVLALS